MLFGGVGMAYVRFRIFGTRHPISERGDISDAKREKRNPTPYDSRRFAFLSDS